MRLSTLVCLYCMFSISTVYALEFLDTIDYDALSPDTQAHATHHKGYITRNLSDGQQIQLFYALAGEGDTTLVFIHGFPYSSAQWNKQVEDLSKDYQVLTLDIRGMGSSSRVPITSFAEYVDDLHFVLTELGINKPVVIGHSSGGLIAALYAIEFPIAIERLILVNSSSQLFTPSPGIILEDLFSMLRSSAKESDFERFAAQWNEQAFNNAADIADLVYTFNYMTVCNEPAMLINCLEQCLATDIAHLLPNIKVPTLIIAGAHDAIVPSNSTMQEAIPESELFTFQDCGHLPFAMQPERFNLVVRDFVRS